MSSDSDPPDPSRSPESEPSSGPRPMTPFSATGWAMAATFLFVVCGGILVALRPGSEHDIVSSVGCQAIAYLITLFLILMVHAPEAGVRDFVGMRPTHWGFYVLGAGLGAALYAPSEVLYALIERRWPSHLEDHIGPALLAASRPKQAAIALAVSLFGPMLEEVLFRGALFRPLLKAHPAPAVIGVSATLFALAHVSFQSFLPIGLLGLCLGFLRWTSGSLVPSMLVHVTFNAIGIYLTVAQRADLPVPTWILAASGGATLLLLGAVRFVGAHTLAARIAQEHDRR